MKIETLQGKLLDRRKMSSCSTAAERVRQLVPEHTVERERERESVFLDCEGEFKTIKGKHTQWFQNADTFSNSLSVDTRGDVVDSYRPILSDLHRYLIVIVHFQYSHCCCGVTSLNTTVKWRADSG